MINNELDGLFGIEESDAFDIDHVLDCEFLLFYLVLLLIHYQRILRSLPLLDSLFHLLGAVVVERDILILTVLQEYDGLDCVHVGEHEVVKDCLVTAIVEGIHSLQQRVHHVRVQGRYHYLLL